MYSPKTLDIFGVHFLSEPVVVTKASIDQLEFLLASARDEADQCQTCVFYMFLGEPEPPSSHPLLPPNPFTSMSKLTPQESFHLAHPTHYAQLIPGNRPTHYPIQVTPPNHISLHLAHSTSPNVPFRILSGTTGSDLPLLSFRSSALGTQAWHFL